MHGDRRDDDGGRWRLLVLEDAGEPLAVFARARGRPGPLAHVQPHRRPAWPGRALRIAGHHDEPLGRLHPAVRRPGCCWAQVGFTPFAPAEATAWLAHHGCEETVHAPATLAELYARLEGRTVGRGAAGRGLRLRRQARSKRNALAA